MTGVSEPAGLRALLTHARGVPSEERERFALAAERVAADPRAILLRTCHRVELYVNHREGAPGPLPALPELPPGGRRLAGADAVRHLLSVAAGFDSVVVGEDQILHQLRDCLGRRHEPAPASRTMPAATLDPVLERLFQLALHVGRETRSWREGGPRSLADVALDALERPSGPLAGRVLLVVGAGSMGRLAAIAGARRGARVVVANRTPARAAALAADVGGTSVAIGPDEPLPACDAIVMAIGGRWELGAAAAARLVENDVRVADLSSPPALDAGLREALGARYHSADDFAREPQDPVRDRLVRRFERLLDASGAEFLQWCRMRDAVPAIQALTERVEDGRAEEVDRLFRRLAGLEPHDRELVEQMTHRLVARILHCPLATLREDETGDLERAARVLFAL